MHVDMVEDVLVDVCRVEAEAGVVWLGDGGNAGGWGAVVDDGEVEHKGIKLERETDVFWPERGHCGGWR